MSGPISLLHLTPRGTTGCVVVGLDKMTQQWCLTLSTESKTFGYRNWSAVHRWWTWCPIATIYCQFLVSPVQGWAKWLHPCHRQFFGILFGVRNFIYPSEFSMKSPCLHPAFGPPFTSIPSLSEVSKVLNFFIKSGNEMLKLGSWCTSFESNYSACTCRSSKNICSISGGAQEKRQRERVTTVWNSVYHKKNGAFLIFTPSPLMLMYFFAGFFLNLTWFWTKIRVLMFFGL